MSDPHSPNHFVEVFATNYGNLVKSAQTWVGDEWDAEDVVQQAALRAWQRRGEIDVQSELKQLQLAQTMVRLQVLNLLRHKSRSNNRARMTCIHDFEVCSPVVFDNHCDDSLISLVDLAMDQLADQDSCLLRRHLVDGVGSRQLAEELGRSQSSVCNSLRRARGRLADKVNRLAVCENNL